MKAFSRAGDGHVTTTLAPDEAALLSELAGQIADMLAPIARKEQGADATGGGDPDSAALRGDDSPDDSSDGLPDGPAGALGGATYRRTRTSALDRLLPDAYRGDEEAAAEFRRFTAGDLSERKIRNAAIVMADLSDAPNSPGPVDVTLDPDSVQAWLRSLTDIRLVVASRLGIDSDDGWNEDSDDENELMHGELYDWLGWIQDSLLSAFEDRA
ncbi:MAG: DUF2017 domain-containing protein [Burkholderiaceae bacterium]|nr:DUF2017 domain-containing protein [Microbacteriaceae bacterium]